MSQVDTSHALDAIAFPLWGSRLIEASAGTGKTWTIAALYLRLVLGHGGEQAFARPLRPSDILVMTFTRAATRELSDRIRARLLEAAHCFRGEATPADHDTLLIDLLAAYPEGPARSDAAWRLATAAEGMDDASVHTIDAWCQRMLREHAFDSGCLFDEELMADEHSMLVESAQDYWRQHVYPLQGSTLDQVLAVWGHVDKLVEDMRQLIEQTLPSDAKGQGSLGERVQQVLAERQASLQALSQGWVERAQAMQNWLDEQLAPKTCEWDKRKLQARYYTPWLAALSAWAQAPEQPLVMPEAAIRRFCDEGMAEARKDGRLPDGMPDHFGVFAALVQANQALPDPQVALRLHAALNVRARLASLKRQAGTFGFADMLHRLDRALSGPQGERLRERMVAQYPVALIDEFQDTSPLQYSIFNQLYRTADNDRQTALLLIGDPKQSIYGFRGADIYSYLQARRATTGRHYVLGTNHRSSQALVKAVNHWFSRAEARLAEGAFMFRDGRDDPLPFVPVQARGRAEHFVDSHGPVPAMLVQHDLNLRSAEDSRRLLAARCAEQIVMWLNDAQAGFVQPDQALQRLRPADIAVLVRTGKEADAVRRELRRRGVASVYLSDKDSVFDSDEARDLLHWLKAVASPLDVRLARAGLATRTVGLSLDELACLASDDEAFDMRSEQLRGLHSVWQGQGVLTMLRQTLHQLDLPVRWLAQPDGERRLTNFLHLAELLQSASTQLDGEQALIRWLSSQMADSRAGSDEQVVRLESDADLVKVVTVHKSKGLEYAVVCLPFACSFRKMERTRTPYVNLADDDGARTLRLQYSDDELARADRERLREDLRLFYVALTRARHAMWLGFAALKVGNAKDCQTHHSAAGYLAGGAEPMAAESWLPQLQDLAASHPEISLLPLEDSVGRTRLSRRETQAELQDRPAYSAAFDRRWTIGSFSSLVRAMGAMSTMLSPVHTVRPADDEQGLTADEAVVATTVALPVASTEVAVWHGFARGALAGNFLHDQLEWLAGEGFALGDEDDRLAARLRRRCDRAGRGHDADAVLTWLRAVVRTPLPGPQAALQDLHQLLPEMEFWLPAGHLQAQAVDVACRQHLLDGQPRPDLPERELHGMLMGFADLVFEHEGRYWVLDYKSNHLGDDGRAYHRQALQSAMAEHRYDVQAAIYMLALHRLLTHRLGEAYDPAQHLGGAVYLFLRGIDGPEQGVYLVPPSLALLLTLDGMLTAQEVVA